MAYNIRYSDYPTSAGPPDPIRWVGPPGPPGPQGEPGVDGTQGLTHVVVADTAPSGAPDTTLWWDSAGTGLYVRYNDGNSTQWVVAQNQNVGSGAFLPLSGGTVTGTTDFTLGSGNPAQIASFFRYGYAATATAVGIQNAGSSSSNTNFQTLVISSEMTHDNDAVNGATGALAISQQITGKSHIDLYALHAVTYIQNLASDNTPFLGDGSSQHGGIATQSVKTLPSGGVPSGKRMPDMFTHWWQTINETNLGSSNGGADVALEADVVCNGPDDIWKVNNSGTTCNATAGSAVLTGVGTPSSPFRVGQMIAVSQTGDTYIICNIVSLTSNTITMDSPAVNTITGAIVANYPGGTRFSFQNVLSLSTLPAAGGKPLEWGYGHFQDSVDDPTNGEALFSVGFAYYAGYYVAASDYSLAHFDASPYSADGIQRGVAIKLAAGQKIAFNGDGYRGTWLTGTTGGGLQLVKDTTVVASFDATGALAVPQIAVGGSSGPTWTTGTAAPSATAPIGSLYSRIGGAVGATLYVSRGGGTWAAVAGV